MKNGPAMRGRDFDRECPSVHFLSDLFSARHDSLVPYRDRIMLSIGAIVEVLLTPFTVYNALQHAVLVGGVLLTVQILLLVDLLAIWHRRPPPVPPVWLLLPFVLGMTVAIVRHGGSVALWSFPVVVYCYFVLERRTALMCSLAVICYMSLLAYRFGSLELALRLGVSLLLTVVMINVVLNVVFDLHQRLAAQAFNDPLTGCLNRRSLYDCLQVSVSRSVRHCVPACLLMIDVDHFKIVNDRFGHAKGDVVLQELTRRVRMRMRFADRLFRYGGEEFVLLLEDTPELGASILAEAIRAGIASENLLEGHPVTVSIGISAYRSEYSIDDWLTCADRALYQAKRKGRNRVCCLSRPEWRDFP